MIDKININPIRDQVDGPAAGQSGRPKPSPNAQADATLQINFDHLIEQANKIPTDDTNAVQKARQLLQSGQLDNPSNIKEAAENILKFGV
jgi:hypothetical protein